MEEETSRIASANEVISVKMTSTCMLQSKARYSATVKATLGVIRQMCIRDRLMETQYKDQMRINEIKLNEQKLSMLYLKSQVNPHFLYNTLDNIRIRAQINGDTEVCYMLMELVKFFRLNVKAVHQFVTLDHEFSLIDSLSLIHI